MLDLITEDEYADACNPKLLEKLLLNGADSWGQYSWGGCWLIYDSDIAERYCTASELKKTKGGKLRPNKNESWIEVQARALGQAASLIMRNCRQDDGGAAADAEARAVMLAISLQRAAR